MVAAWAGDKISAAVNDAGGVGDSERAAPFTSNSYGGIRAPRLARSLIIGAVSGGSGGAEWLPVHARSAKWKMAVTAAAGFPSVP
jgi:hypothetical protein